MIDKIFKSYDIRAAYPTPLSEEVAWKVGYATALYLQRSRAMLPPKSKVQHENIMVIGRDMRPSSPALSKSLSDGIRSAGMNVIDLGMVDTPMVDFAINHLGTVGGIQTTGSHHPPQINGFKINGPKAKPIGAASGLEDIKRISMTLRVGQTGLRGQYEECDLWPQYKQHVLQFLKLGRKLRIAVDASNGMGGNVVPTIFGGLTRLEIMPLLFEITGSFVHDPQPLVESNLAMLKSRVIETKADFGVCFDGDGDCCAFVDETGQAIGCDLITALLARDFLQMPENRGSTIVYDARSSHVVPEEIRDAGGVPRRDRVGQSFMKKAMFDTRAVLGGESSGHFYFRDNFGCDSASIALARVLSIVSLQTSKTLGGLIAPLRRYFQSGELTFRVEEKEKDARIREVADCYKKGQIDYVDGVTIDLGDWWLNIRKSGNDPLLRLNVEAGSLEVLQQRLAEIKRILGEPAASR